MQPTHLYSLPALARYPADVVIAALRPHLLPERAAKLDAVVAARLYGVQAVLEDLRDPHNAGAALRSCESMGVLRVHIVSVHHRFRTAARVTQGCEKWLEVVRWGEVESCAAALRAAGGKLYAGVPGAAVALADLDPYQPMALAFGNEHTGLSPRLLSLCDGEFTIPMHGCSQSLNVSVSAAVSLHVVTEARRRSLGRPGDLDEPAQAALRARYYALDLRAPEQIVERYLAQRAG